MNAVRLLVAGAGALAMVLSASATPGSVLRFALPGWVELEMVEVGGKCRLPLESLYQGQKHGVLTAVTAPKYWIGRFEVSQKQYRAVMGENPSRDQSDSRLPVTDVRWRDAVAFCNRLNYSCQGKLPPGYRFDLPTLVEWAHAFVCGTTNNYRYAGSDDIDKVAWHGFGANNGSIRFSSLHLPGLKEPNAIGLYDMSGNVGEFVFVADSKGGNVRMGGSYRFPEHFCELEGTSMSSQDSVQPDLGFRVALVPIKGYDPDGKTLTMASKGRILLRSGCAKMAREYLTKAFEIDGVAETERDEIRKSWVEADQACGYYSGDWHYLLTTLSERLAKSEFRTADIFRFWKMDEAEADYKQSQGAVINRYKAADVHGFMVKISDLPKEVRAVCGASMARKVQAVSCDFTGDGLKDLVVEIVGKPDAGGDLYGFFERIRNGGYRLIGEPVRTVGLCVIPHANRQIYFLSINRVMDDVLAPCVLTFSNVRGKAKMQAAWPFDRSFYLEELDDGKVNPKSPYTGKRNIDRIMCIARGEYTKALCWPWRRK